MCYVYRWVAGSLASIINMSLVVIADGEQLYT